MDIHAELVDSHTEYDITSCCPVGIYGSSKNGLKCRMRRLWIEFAQNGLSKDQEYVHAFRRQSVIYTCWIWHGQLLPAGCKLQLNTACKYVKLDCPATSRIVKLLFNVQSPNFTGTSMPTYSTATLDTTSSATSGRHLSKLDKTAENAASDCFGSNFSAAAFRLPHQLVGVLFNTCELTSNFTNCRSVALPQWYLHFDRKWGHQLRPVDSKSYKHIPFGLCSGCTISRRPISKMFSFFERVIKCFIVCCANHQALSIVASENGAQLNLQLTTHYINGWFRFSRKLQK